MSLKKIAHKCVKCGIASKEDSSLSFHRFPLPSKQHGPLKAKVWAKFCFPNEDWASEKYLTQLHAQHKMLCGKHFDDCSFTSNERKKLNNFAIPTEAQSILSQLREEQSSSSGDGHKLQGPRVSHQQRKAMLQFMINHQDFARGRGKGPDAARKRQHLLVKLASTLNAIVSGAKKIPEKWWKCWLDWRCDTKAKALRLRKHAATSDGGPSPAPLSVTEKNLLRFCGVEMVEDQSPEPEEEELALDSLEETRTSRDTTPPQTRPTRSDSSRYGRVSSIPKRSKYEDCGYEDPADRKDEYYYWAQAFAADLRKMEHKQQLYTKKAVADILVEGQLGLLHRDSVKVNDSRRPRFAEYTEPDHSHSSPDVKHPVSPDLKPPMTPEYLDDSP